MSKSYASEVCMEPTESSAPLYPETMGSPPEGYEWYLIRKVDESCDLESCTWKEETIQEYNSCHSNSYTRGHIDILTFVQKLNRDKIEKLEIKVDEENAKLQLEIEANHKRVDYVYRQTLILMCAIYVIMIMGLIISFIITSSGIAFVLKYYDLV